MDVSRGYTRARVAETSMVHQWDAQLLCACSRTVSLCIGLLALVFSNNKKYAALEEHPVIMGYVLVLTEALATRCKDLGGNLLH